MKIALIVVGLLVVAVVAVVIFGRLLPERHHATATRDIAASRTRVAAIVREVEQQPTWRRGLKRIEVVERTSSAFRYIEHGSNGAIPFAFREVVADAEFHSVIDTEALPFGGTWTITLTVINETTTKVSIREDGIVRSPLFRFVSHYVMGHTRTIDAYLNDLAAAVN